MSSAYSGRPTAPSRSSTCAEWDRRDPGRCDTAAVVDRCPQGEIPPGRSSTERRQRLAHHSHDPALSVTGGGARWDSPVRTRSRWSAIVNSGESWPSRRITVGLSPASLPKRGSGFDIGIACAILAASGAFPSASLDGIVLIGELGLDGRIRPVPGVLPAAAAAAGAGFGSVVVASENAAEAALVPELRVVAAPTLSALTSWLRSGRRE